MVHDEYAEGTGAFILSTEGEAYVRKSQKVGNEIVCNLPLQMSLYFNVTFFPFWLVTIMVLLTEKYNCLYNIYQVIIVIIMIIVIPVECLRLYLGYMGNLSEKMPELAGFWMLSLLVQLPLQTFLLFSSGTESQPAEWVVQGVMQILLTSQLLFGFFSLQRLSKHRAISFHLAQIRRNYFNN